MEPKVVCVTELSVDPWDPCQGCLKGPSKIAWITSTRGKILPDSGLWVWAFLRVNEDPLIQDRKIYLFIIYLWFIISQWNKINYESLEEEI